MLWNQQNNEWCIWYTEFTTEQILAESTNEQLEVNNAIVLPQLEERHKQKSSDEIWKYQHKYKSNTDFLDNINKWTIHKIKEGSEN